MVTLMVYPFPAVTIETLPSSSFMAIEVGRPSTAAKRFMRPAIFTTARIVMQGSLDWQIKYLGVRHSFVGDIFGYGSHLYANWLLLPV
jgi:hypothetical protein